ncbi:hypothetical protein [Sorangium atrum]|uniref:Uncharacterized protein n=1 Tax=Sorangium atrum TaxID=2995308 RepID=A0ABT5C9L1_9BACT|nr:hypothetical protein [Sorangium aterium]MDC0682454.1 hypothetical protein [Sorangium aterium]
MLLDRSFRRTLLAGLLLSAGPSTAAAPLIAAPGCAGNDIRCFEWPEELGACLDRDQAREELNLIKERCSDLILSVESDAKQRDGACCYEVISTKVPARCHIAGGGGGRGGPSEGTGGRLEGGGGQSEGGGGQSEGGGGQSEGGGGQSEGGGGQSEGGGGQSAGGGGQSAGGGGRF